MALRFLARAAELVEPTQAEARKPGFSWDKWYDENKTRLSKKKAHRYATDPEYRAAALERSRNQRASKKQLVTDGHTVSFNEMAKALDVTIWVLREWRRKDYFPEPFHREGRLWFRPEQEHLLQRVKDFFDTTGSRVTDADNRQKLANIVSGVYANWE